MDSMSFARRCAQVAVLAAVAWAGLFISQRVAALDFKSAKEILESATSFISRHFLLRGIHLVFVFLQLPVFVSLRGSLRKQDESLSSLAHSLMLLAIGFLAFADGSQILVLPPIVAEYQREALAEFAQPPSTATFAMYYSAYYDSVPFAVQALGHLFYAASLIVFAVLLGWREKTITSMLIACAGAVILAHLLALAGRWLADVVFFAAAAFQAVLLFLLARKFSETLRKRERGY
jgi:hypothetical protein